MVAFGYEEVMRWQINKFFVLAIAFAAGSLKYVSAQGCGGNLVATNSTQEEYSIGYPDYYESDSNCTWTITSNNEGISLYIKLVDLQTETCCDYLKVYEGDNLLGTYQGSKSNVNIVVHRNRARLVFHSDSSVSAKGFLFQYREVTTCGYSSVADNSVLSVDLSATSAVQECGWNFYSAGATKIGLKIAVALQNASESVFEVYEGNVLAEQLTGGSSVSDTFSSTSVLRIYYFSSGTPDTVSSSANSDVNECLASPCQNNATCSDGVLDYTCFCVPGYTGKNCSIDINECEPMPCFYDSNCTDHVNGYSCDCTPGYTDVNCSTDINECQSNPCANGGACYNRISRYDCVCVPGYNGTNCETEINECESSPCHNGGNCTDLLNDFNCTCVIGFTGKNCSINIDDCDPSPCQHDSTCNDLIADYECVCLDGFTDKNCSTDINECLPGPCINGSCVDMVNNYSCVCTPGYAGRNCSIDIDDCLPEPCGMTGNCTDAVNDYSCACVAGYTGKNCSINIDDCAPSPCAHNATCVDRTADYECVCPPGYTDKNCSTDINECLPGPCDFGSCTDLVNNYTCACTPGYTGRNCSIDIDECFAAPCEHGNCTDLVNDYNCTCEAGYTDKNCSTDINECASDPCQNNATCNDQVNAYTCACLPGYNGTHCETDIDECAANPCLHGGSCVDLVNDYNCTCAPTFSGKNCSVVDFCFENPCGANGNCTNEAERYICACVPGYTNTNCSQEINECDAAPCENNATCTDLFNDFNCSCLTGFTGKNCTTNIDDCHSMPCLNGATCIDEINNYRCNCSPGYTDYNCSTDINECLGDPCTNGNCTDLVNDYNCTCVAGYGGKNCTEDIDECMSDPCHSHGNCTDIFNGYNCTCRAGYEGSDCSIDINECASDPCLNNASCVDRENEFFCSCKPGFNGVKCEIDIDECAPSPCGEHGNCTEFVNGYNCACEAGFTGRNCSIDIDECTSSPCQNRGTCVNLVNGYECNCLSSFTGLNCQNVVDVCMTANCHHDATCVVISPSFECQCNDGYEGDGFHCQPFCKAAAVFDGPTNRTYRFPRSSLGESPVSNETCSNGRAEATASCLVSETDGPPAELQNIRIVSCSVNLTAVANAEVAPTTEVVANAVVDLKLLTSQPGDVSSSDADAVADTIITISSLDPQNVNITPVTLLDALVAVDQISGSLSQNETSNPTERKRLLLESIQTLADRVQLTNNETLTLQTGEQTLQVAAVAKVGSSFVDARFLPRDKSGVPYEPSVSSLLPAALLERAAGQLGTDSLRISFVLYENGLLHPKADGKLSQIISANIRDYKIAENSHSVVTTFNNVTERQGAVPLPSNPLKETVTRTQCVSLESDFRWSPDHCRLVQDSNSSDPRCDCSTLTNFAMIISSVVLPSAAELNVASWIGLILSTLGLSMTIVIYASIGSLRVKKPTLFLLNVCVCLLIVNILFLAGSNKVEDRSVCYLVTVLLQYFLLAAWFWMAASALDLYNALVTVMQGGGDAIRLGTAIASYVVPLLIVLVHGGVAILYIDQQNYREDDILFESVYRARHICWLHKYSLDFGFLLPIGLLALLNLALFCRIFSSLTCKKNKIRSSAQKRSALQEFMLAMTLVLSMGLTWLFGFLMLFADDVYYQSVMAWLFTLFNSTQGLLIFLFNCVRNENVRRLWLHPVLNKLGCSRFTVVERTPGTRRTEVTTATPNTATENTHL